MWAYCRLAGQAGVRGRQAGREMWWRSSVLKMSLWWCSGELRLKELAVRTHETSSLGITQEFSEYRLTRVLHTRAGGDQTGVLRLMWWVRSRFAYCVPHKQQTGRGEDTGQTDQEVNKTWSHSWSRQWCHSIVGSGIYEKGVRMTLEKGRGKSTTGGYYSKQK